MATKTFEELKQMAIQIRDEKTNKQNTATRIGTQMLEHLNKLEQDFLDKDTTEAKFSELDSKTGFQRISTKQGIDIPFDNTHKRLYVKIINSIRPTVNYFVFGFRGNLGDNDYDTLATLKVGEEVFIELNDNYDVIRLYEQGTTTSEYNWEYIFQPLQYGVIDSEYYNSQLGILEKKNYVTSNSNKDISPVKNGEVYKITLNSYNGSEPVYVFGMINDSPQEYDTFSRDLQVGQTISIALKKDYLSLRVYKRESTEEIDFTIQKSGSIIADIEQNKNDIVQIKTDTEQTKIDIVQNKTFVYNNIKTAGIDIPVEFIGGFSFTAYNNDESISDIAIIGYLSDSDDDYETIMIHSSSKNLEVASVLKDYVKIRFYNRKVNEEGAQLDWHLTYNPIKKGIISKNDLFTTKVTTTTANIHNFIYNVPKGALLKVKVNKYTGSNPIFIFGIKEDDTYDTYENNLTLGVDYIIKTYRDYKNLRIYKNDNVEMVYEYSYSPLYSVDEEFHQDKESFINSAYIDITTQSKDFSLKYDIGDTLKFELENKNKENFEALFLFGMISDTPQEYDTLATTTDYTSGEIVLDKQYIDFRVYQRASDSYDISAKLLITKNKSNKIGDKDEIDTVDRLEVLSENPLEYIKKEPGYGSIIHNWGFVGDSLSSGCTECFKGTSSKVFLDLFEYSWGQRLCKLLGVEGYNFSYSGQTTKGWIDGSKTPPQTTTDAIPNRIWEGAKSNPKQAYTIALGVNDSSLKQYPVGTTEDIDLSDYNNNAETFVGYYGGIIQRLREIQPNAPIFCVTKMGEDEYNVQIRLITELFEKCYLIDLARYSVPFSGTWSDRYSLGGHKNAAGYQYMAYVMNTYIDWIIRNNWEDFKDIALVGTEYTATYP
ncbi:MAG: SGNH/GDSL hydrolase family protein [Candidatus Phocaeicola faecigallinarum]|uniref:SGNH/GDSL hydrolase family protein n=1 Tax=Candidatus Phocaeicola faecigallinarum TaxID=2838732 RepID=A0A948TC80_9BACT|nr:SGNH/GDSL hydrolase family protein [Candidatus Phocaeicola faecigallinarum]